jgi:hypothetical protein
MRTYIFDGRGRTRWLFGGNCNEKTFILYRSNQESMHFLCLTKSALLLTWLPSLFFLPSKMLEEKAYLLNIWLNTLNRQRRLLFSPPSRSRNINWLPLPLSLLYIYFLMSMIGFRWLSKCWGWFWNCQEKQDQRSQFLSRLSIHRQVWIYDDWYGARCDRAISSATTTSW